MVREFRFGRNMLVLHEQMKLSELEKRMITIQRDHDQGLDTPDADAVFEEFGRHVLRLGELILQDKGLAELPRVGIAKYKTFLKRVMKEHLPFLESKDFLFVPDDWISTTETTWLDDLLFAHPKAWCLGCLRRKPRDGEDGVFHVDQNDVKNVIVGLIVFASGLTLLPVAILYLLSLSKAMEVVVVTLFGVAFAAVVAKLYDINNSGKISAVLICLCGYVAVMLGALAGLGNGSC